MDGQAEEVESKPSWFLAIPLEVRLTVYGIVIDKYPPPSLAILNVCKQIREEAFPVLLRDTKYFKRFEGFRKWIFEANPKLLEKIVDIDIRCKGDWLSAIADDLVRLEGADELRKITSRWWEAEHARHMRGSEPVEASKDALSLPQRIVQVISSLTHGEPSAIKTTWDGLSALPNVQKLWISLGRGRGGNERRDFKIEQQLLLDVVPAAMPNMRSFTFFPSLISLRFLGGFTELRELRFTGYSTSTPEDTLIILRSLKRLHTLIVYRYPEFYDGDSSIVTAELPKYLSLTPDVISGLNPLRELVVYHMTSKIPSAHVTTSVVESLRLAHRESLQSLRLHSDHVIDEEVLRELLRLMSQTVHLRRLSLRLILNGHLENLDIRPFLPATVGEFEGYVKVPKKKVWLESMSC